MEKTSNTKVVATSVQDQEPLEFHSIGKSGKLEIVPKKPIATQFDLSWPTT